MEPFWAGQDTWALIRGGAKVLAGGLLVVVELGAMAGGLELLETMTGGREVLELEAITGGCEALELDTTGGREVLELGTTTGGCEVLELEITTGGADDEALLNEVAGAIEAELVTREVLMSRGG